MNEPKGFCCLDGKISLITNNAPEELYDLCTQKKHESLEFHKYIRTYNNNFAFTSLSVKYDRNLSKKSKDIYTFRVQGQMYHFFNEILPSDNRSSCLNFTFMIRNMKLKTYFTTAKPCYYKPDI